MQDSSIADEISLFKSFPYILVIVALILWISSLVRYRIQSLGIYQELVEEVEDLVLEVQEQGNEFVSVKNRFSLLKNNKSANKEDQLRELVKLRDELQNKISKNNDPNS